MMRRYLAYVLTSSSHSLLNYRHLPLSPHSLTHTLLPPRLPRRRQSRIFMASPIDAASTPLSVGFFGGGMMAEAIVKGILSSDVVPPSAICILEPFAARREALSKLRVHTTASPSEMLSRSSVVFIAVKPDIVPIIMRDVVAHEKASTAAPQLLVSICAGLTLETLLAGGPASRKMVRVMPNQPCVVSEAACAYVMSESCDAADRAVVEKLMSACGAVFEVPEKKMNAVTGVSGSGPAYVFTMIEAMSDAGVLLGLPRAMSTRLAAQTVKGAAEMVLTMPDVHPAELRNRVESPGGATIMASYELEGGFRKAVIDAVKASANKATEMGKEK